MTDRRPARGLDADELARLEEERDFLLDSLDDLDAEHAVGDISADDHASLRDDYTRRAAEVMRAIDEQREAFASIDRGISIGRRIATFAAVAVVVAVAGVLLARAVGFRTPADTITGDVRQTTAGLLAEADTLTREGQFEAAIERYDELLDQEPANVEALTYRGWLTAQTGDDAAALATLGDAVAIDPTYPDAHVFRALIFRRTGRWDDAAAELETLDSLDLPPAIESMLVSSDIRAEVMAVRIDQLFGAGEDVDLAALGIDDSATAAQLDQVSLGASIVESNGNPDLAIRVFTAVIDRDPEHVVTLVNMGRRGATCELQAAAPDVAAQLRTLLDRAVDLAPAEPEPLMWRAVGRVVAGDGDAAEADLVALQALSGSEGFVEVVERVTADGC